MVLLSIIHVIAKRKKKQKRVQNCSFEREELFKNLMTISKYMPYVYDVEIILNYTVIIIYGGIDRDL